VRAQRAFTRWSSVAVRIEAEAMASVRLEADATIFVVMHDLEVRERIREHTVRDHLVCVGSEKASVTRSQRHDIGVVMVQHPVSLRTVSALGIHHVAIGRMQMMLRFDMEQQELLVVVLLKSLINNRVWVRSRSGLRVVDDRGLLRAVEHSVLLLRRVLRDLL